MNPFLMANYPGRFTNGVSIGNVPVVNTHPGKVFWVSSTTGSDGNAGTFQRPFATVDKAISLCTASKGDMVMLMPGHAESIANATTFQIDIAGVNVIGLGAGANRPTFSFTDTAGSVEMDAANCVIDNVRFLADISAVVVCINVDAANCTIRNCEFNFVDTGDDFILHIDCDDVAGTVIEANRFVAEDATGSNAAVRLQNSDHSRIVGNFATGDFAKAPIWSDTTGDTGGGSQVSSSILISGNQLRNSDTGGIAIDLNNADTGIISYNALTAPAGVGLALILDPGSCLCIENYGADAIDETGAIVPQTAAT
jgi:hypothetical protein